MKHGVSRRAWDEYEATIDDPDHPESQYPKTIQGAAAELRARHYNASVDKLWRLVAAGRIESSTRARRLPSWSPDRIDAAACVFEETGAWTPAGHACHYLGLAGDDLFRAERDHPDAPVRLVVFPIGDGCFGCRFERHDEPPAASVVLSAEFEIHEPLGAPHGN